MARAEPFKVLFLLKHVEFIDPMGIMLLSALAKRAGCETRLAVLSDRDVLKEIEEWKPRVVASSVKTGEHKYYFDANRRIKERFGDRVFTVVGGPHPTYMPSVVEREEFDAVCCGEGFDAWPELLVGLQGGGDVNAIPNIVTKENWDPERSAESYLRPRKHDLDALPFLDRDLVYRATRLGRFPMRSLMSSFGCPFRCTYCFNHRFNAMYRGKGSVFQRFSVERLLAELRDVKDRWPNTQFVKFYDDIFGYRDDEWLEEFAERYPREVGLPWHCLIRCDSAARHPRMLELFKKAGIQSVSMSIECADDWVRETVVKRDMTREHILAAFAQCRKLGIHTFSNSIFAIPVPEEMRKAHGKQPIDYDIATLDLNIEAGVTFGEFGSLFPYPGNEMADYLIRTGSFDGNFDNLATNYSNASPLACFTDEEKLMQHNLTFLSLVCLVFPRLRNVTVKYLIRWRLTVLYFIACYLCKVYLVKTKVYPMRFRPLDVVRNFWYSFVLEWFKRLSGDTAERLEGKKSLWRGVVGGLLGGPWRK